MSDVPRYLDACPVGCQSSLIPTDIALPEGCLLRCDRCGQLVSQCPEAGYWASMAEFDDPQGTLPSAASAKRRFANERKRLEQIARFLDQPKHEIRLLDVGCSSGAFLGVAKTLGFERAEGVEPAPKAAQSALASGLKVYQGTLQEVQFAAHSFDAVTLFEVIEHLKDPISLLHECHRVIRPGGVMMIGTGNADSWTVAVMKGRWEYFHVAKHGGHVSFFRPASIRLLAQRTGFAVEKVSTRNVRFYEKGDLPRPAYQAAKAVSELANIPARRAGKGHDMLVCLRRLGQ